MNNPVKQKWSSQAASQFVTTSGVQFAAIIRVGILLVISESRITFNWYLSREQKFPQWQEALLITYCVQMS